MIRITADLDNIKKFIAICRTQAVINYIHKTFGVIIDKKEIRLSSSKKGCHVILWTSDKLNKDMIFFIRAMLGDDIKRIQLDKARKYPKQYLFKKKNKNDWTKDILPPNKEFLYNIK